MLVLGLFSNSQLSAPNIPGGLEVLEHAFFDELNECTTGLASGLATPDGRPLLWKNRDVGNANQEWHYVDDGRIPFVGLTYRNEATNQYYAGLNAVGFSVENSNSYNLPAGPNSNGWGFSDDDGEIQNLALATCRTVDDFEILLDSLDEAGRTLNCNYGAFDAFGGAAMFETAGFSYVRLDAAEEPDGFIVRSNYSYSGNGLNNRPSYWGPNRYDRAYDLFKSGVEANALTAQYIYQTVIRNFNADGMENYQLPYDGYYEEYPYGLIPNGETVCRSTTRSIMVSQGTRAGERPDDAMIWAMVGNPLGSIVTPLWVRAGSVPLEFDGPNGARLCDLATGISSWVYEQGNFGSAVNTWKLTNPEGTGYWDWSLPLESMMFERVERFRNSPGYSYDRLAAFQNLITRQIADSIASWKPAFTTMELAELIFWDSNVVLNWNYEDQETPRDDDPRGYRIFRSEEPFRAGSRGELIAEVEQIPYLDEAPPAKGAFYRIEAIY